MSPPTNQPAGSTWSVFLSSTIRDFDDIRREVQDALLRKVEAACFLSEDWPGGFDDVLEKCRQRVLASDGFFLLLGYWYGWVPPGHQRSVTHLEFDWATERWRDKKFPPMAVMVPKAASDVETKLKAAASAILDDMLKAKKIDQAEHTRQLGDFHAAVFGSGRTVTTFESVTDLLLNVLVNCLQWQGRTPMAAARREVTVEIRNSAAPQVSDEQLGRLGRRKQFEAVADILAEIGDHSTEPAVALLVHGHEDYGHRPFLLRLIATTFKNHCPKSRVNRVPFARHDPSVLTPWIAGQLGLGAGGSMQSPEHLAERVAMELREQPLYFILDRVGDLPGGLTTFREAFWRPFQVKLRTLCADQPLDHRLIAVVTDYTTVSAGATTAIRAWNDRTSSPDYSRLLVLPRLHPFTRIDLLNWLEEMNVIDRPAGRRKLLADRALKNDKGVEDPLPSRVFDRLRGETLWPEGD